MQVYKSLVRAFVLDVTAVVANELIQLLEGTVLATPSLSLPLPTLSPPALQGFLLLPVNLRCLL